MRRLRTACERAKRVLSSSTVATIEIDSLFDGIDFHSDITRARFEDLCGDYFRDCLAPVEQVMVDSGLSKSQIDDIVLVGGSTRIPKVQAIIKEYFNGKEATNSINPDEAVAYGAAVQGAILSGVKNTAIDDMLLIDVAPLSLGIKTAGDVLTKVVERNTSIPCCKSKVFSTATDNQPAVTIDVYQGDRAMVKDNHRLGQFDLVGIKPAPCGQPQIEVSFDIDANGILNVTAKDMDTGKSNNVVIENDSSRLTKEEIDKMIHDSERFADDDKENYERIQAKNELEALVYSIKHTLDDNDNGMNKDNHIAASEAVQACQDWLEKNDTADIDALRKQKESLSTMWQSVKPTEKASKEEAPANVQDVD